MPVPSKNGMVVVLLGSPGVGKGTQGIRLGRELGWAHVSTGDLLRAALKAGTALGLEARKYMDAGELVPDDVIVDLVREHLAGMEQGQRGDLRRVSAHRSPGRSHG